MSDSKPSTPAEPAHSLSEHVTLSLESYFNALQDEKISNLHQMVIQQVERPLIQFVLEKHNHNQTQTAQTLGINRNTLRKKMQQYQLCM